MPFNRNAPLEDWWLMLKIAKIKKMKFIRETTFYYRWHSTNTKNNITLMKEMTYKTKMHEMKFLRENEYFLNKVNDYMKNLYKKTIFKLNLFEIYKTKTLNNKIVIIRFGSTYYEIKYKN